MPRTVLVVDDDPEFLAEILQLLKAAGYATLQAKDGREGILAINSHKGGIDGAIVDLALPEIGGFQVIGELTKARGRSPIPLLAITGAYKDLYLEVAEYLGAGASVRKPGPGLPLTPIIEAFNGLMNLERAKLQP